jgi:hypothetical protein
MNRQIFLLLAPALTFLLAIPLAKAEERAAQPQSFATFWAGFKSAVAKNDKEAVAAATELPSLRLSKAAFLKTYPTIFTKKVQKCFATAKPVRTPDRDSYSVFCDSQYFYFEKVHGAYKFTDRGPND